MALTESGLIYVWGGKNPYEGGAEVGAKEWRVPQPLNGVKKKRIRQLEIGRSHYCALTYATSPEFSYITNKKFGPFHETKKENEDEDEDQEEQDDKNDKNDTRMKTMQLGKTIKFGVQAVDDGGLIMTSGCDQFHVSR